MNQSDNNNNSYVCFSKTEALKDIRAYVRDRAKSFGYSKDNVDAIVLAIDEACANVIRHGYHFDECGQLCVESYTDKDDAVFVIKDTCPKVSEKDLTPKNECLSDPGGLGVSLMRTIMDSVTFLSHQGKGNHLELRKKLEH
ncbi:ATP-binding protein [Thalassotalea euphylliae]|uniref:ATP-binding protein n=1 Tax=Thalassotalea euphylliae TaxID=1655234 RepID=UPI0036309722